jgi:hypothetical protein
MSDRELPINPSLIANQMSKAHRSWARPIRTVLNAREKINVRSEKVEVM